ncbi:fibroblast growth factor receptor 4-like [Arctopsyche grandis]|uniref:fibroblast growth factor receptor 4-like n=1 Tax=Arctopsyche grandis TaxID=121162 RepID=UPI00406D77BD
MAFAKLSSVIVLYLFVVESASGLVVDYYCSTNTFGSNSSYLQFTKEVSSTEYAVVNRFKSLHCCAKGYRSIEWYKDSRAYPWAGGVSSFILYPEAANQTIYTQRAVATDSGNYTCILRNDTHVKVHTIMLIPIEKPPQTPRATFTPKDQRVELGQRVRLYCEAFVGRINLPDVRNDISWKRVYPDGTKPHNQHLQQEKITREDDQIIGAYFYINQVKSQDYGQYVCSVANADSVIQMQIGLHHQASESVRPDVSIPWKSLFMVTAGIVVLFIFIVLLYLRVGKKVRLNWMETFAKNPKNDNKVYDALILFTDSTESTTLDCFIPTLQNKYSYDCAKCRLSDEPNEWFDIASQLSKLSRSVVAVISPQEFNAMQLTIALAKLHMLSSNCSPVLVCVQELPKFQPMAKNDKGENLQILLKKTNVILFKDKDFWLKLRLSLPCFNNSIKNKLKTSESETADKTSVEFEEYARTVKRNSHDNKTDADMVV